MEIVSLTSCVKSFSVICRNESFENQFYRFNKYINMYINKITTRNSLQVLCVAIYGQIFFVYS